MENTRVVTNWLTDEIMVIRHLYEPTECEELIRLAEAIGFRPASVRTRKGSQMMPEIRNNDRVNLTSQLLAKDMWRRVEDHLPPVDRAEPVAVDTALRFYKYTKCQRFLPHRDGVVKNSDGDASKYSYLVYLNDGFGGGETRFLLRDRKDQVEGDRRIEVRPERGMGLLFRHRQWHEGLPVDHGIKYVLRTDVFYRDTRDL